MVMQLVLVQSIVGSSPTSPAKFMAPRTKWYMVVGLSSRRVRVRTPQGLPIEQPSFWGRGLLGDGRRPFKAENRVRNPGALHRGVGCINKHR